MPRKTSALCSFSAARIAVTVSGSSSRVGPTPVTSAPMRAVSLRTSSLVLVDGAVDHAPQDARLSTKMAARIICGHTDPGRYRPAIRSAARSAMASTVAFGWALGMVGITDASTTRSPLIPRTRSSVSTTASASGPIRQVPTGW